MKGKWLLAVVAAVALGCGGGGSGGGGGGPARSTITGRVLWIETGSATTPDTTVRSGQDSTVTDPADGFFELTVDSGSSSLTATYAPPSGSPIVRTFTFDPVNGSVDVGDLYIGPQVVSVKGRVADASNGQAVAGAKVALAGRKATSTANGTFSVDGVAYSAANPAVFLGLDGVVTADNYFARHFSPSSLATGGIVDVGTIALTPAGSVDPPPPPYDVQGTASPPDKGANAKVEVLQGNAVVRSKFADAQGRYTFWLPVGNYTLRATSGTSTVTVPFTVASPNVIKTVNVSF